MSRNSSGTYTLPTGNPVVSGTTITTTWANTTLSDIATEMTDSLDRSGKGAMLAPLKSTDGTVSAPGVAFNSEQSSGLYRAGSNDVRLAIGGADVAQFTASGETVTGTVTATSASNSGVVGFSSGATSQSGTAGVKGVSAGTNAGGYFVSQGTGDGCQGRAVGTSGRGGLFTAAGSSNGLEATGGTTNGAGALVTGGGTGPGLKAANGTAATSTAPQDAVQLTNGYLGFSGVTAPASTTAITNELTPTSLVKAWGRLAFDGTSWSVTAGFNVASVATGSSPEFRPTVTMASAMAANTYAVISSGSAGASGSVCVGQNSMTTTQFTLYRFISGTEANSTSSGEYHFFVLGAQ